MPRWGILGAPRMPFEAAPDHLWCIAGFAVLFRRSPVGKHSRLLAVRLGSAPTVEPSEAFAATLGVTPLREGQTGVFS